MNSRRVTVWLDTLSLASLPALFSVHRLSPCDSVRFLRASPGARSVVRLLQALGILHFPCAPIILSEADLRCRDGSSAFFEIRATITRLVARVREQWGHEREPVDLLPSALSRAKVLQFLEKRLAAELHDPVLLLSHVEHCRHHADPQTAHAVLIRDQGWFDLVEPSLGGMDVSISTYRVRLGGPHWASLKAVFRYTLLRMARLCAEAALDSLRRFGRRLSPSKRVMAPTLAIAHKWGIDRERMSDIFFFHGCGIDPRQILIYFDDRSRPLTASGSKAIRALGMRLVVRRRQCSRVGGAASWRMSWHYVRRWTLTVATVTRLIGGSLGRRRPFRRWQVPHLVQLLTAIDYWVAFYRAFDVRIDFHKEETDPNIVARAVAMDLVGGVSVGCHWSYYPLTTIEHSRPHHVYFAWGPYHRPFLHQDGSRVDHLVYSGHIFDGFFGDFQARGRDVRQVLMARGVEFVVSLFDDSYGDDALTSRDAAVKFYSFFVQRLVQNKSLGLVVKSKIPDDVLADVDIGPLLGQAQATGRCVFLGAEPDPAVDVSAAMRCLPVAAAAAADISVALGAPTNSAAIQVALAGFRSICWDSAKHLSHPFYVWGRDRVVFEDLDRLFLAVQDYWDDPLRHADLGDYKPVLADIDPYRDGQAAARVGQYIAWLLEAFEAGADRPTAMDSASRRFRDQYGDWSVETSPIDDEHARAG